MADELSREDMVSMFCSVTNLSSEDAQRHLEAFNWSLEAAVNNALTEGALDEGPPGGGGAGPGAPPQEAPRAARGGETGTDRGGPARREPAPGGAQPQSRLRALLSRLSSTFGSWLLPLGHLLVGTLGFVARLLFVTPFRLLLGGDPALPRRPGTVLGTGLRDRETLDAIASAEAAAFRDAFEERYGGEHAPFHVGSLQQAIDAAKVDLRFVLVHVHSGARAGPEGQELTEAFAREVLSSPLFAALVEQAFVLWVANTDTREGAALARSIGLRDGPALAVVAYGELTGGDRAELRVLERLPSQRCGVAEEVVNRLVAVVGRYEPMVTAAKAERSEREMTRLLREEQEQEFQAALAADQAREREEEAAKKRDAEAEAERQAMEARVAEEAARAEAEAERQIEARRRKADTLPAEPEAGPDVSRILVRMPHGQRITRRWHKAALVQLLFDWVHSVDAEGGHLGDVGLVSHYPRRAFSEEDGALTLEEAGLHPEATLFVQDLHSEEEEEEEAED